MRRSGRYFGPQQQQALLNAVRVCRRECIKGLTVAPIGEPHYLAIRRLMGAMDDLAQEFTGDRRLFHDNGHSTP
jgi:hypothetical protein